MQRFTIVVPTRNRPTELSLTMVGLRQLRHRDFSILVSDNSDQDIVEQNRETVHTILAGVPFKYIRPPRSMNMVDHWNFAVSEATGEYVGIVTDRFTLVPSSLQFIDQILERTATECVCYRHATFNPDESQTIAPIASPTSAFLVPSNDILREFASSKLTKNSPRFLNSFCSRRVLEAVSKRYGRVFGGVSPDYSFHFRFLETFDSFVFLNAPILVDHSPNSSNGVAITHNMVNSASADFLEKIESEQMCYLSTGPIPYDFRILPNIILREMELCRVDAEGKAPLVNPREFYLSCLQYIRRSARFFDEETTQTLRRIERYRISNNLDRPQYTTTLKILRARLKNSMRHSFRTAALSAPVARQPATRDVGGILVRALAATAREVVVDVRKSDQNSRHIEA